MMKRYRWRRPGGAGGGRSEGLFVGGRGRGSPLLALDGCRAGVGARTWRGGFALGQKTLLYDG